MVAASDDARPPVLPVVALSLGLAGVGLALLLTVVPGLPAAPSRLGVPWWLVMPLFVVSEFFAVHLRAGRSAFTVSFGHVPLVLGLSLLTPADFLAASLLGSAVTLLLHRRQRGLRLLFNAGLWTFEAVLAVTLYGLLAGGAPPATLRALLATFATILVTDQLTALAVTAVISVREGALDRESIREALTWGLLVAFCNTSIALLVVVLLEREPVAVPLFTVVLAVLFFSYRAYGQLHDVHAQLERHHGFAQSLARVRGTASVVAEVLERTRETLEAETAELHLHGEVHRSSSSTPAGTATTSPQWLRWVDGVRQGEAVLLHRGTKDPAERALLVGAGVAEAAAAPVRVGDDVVGVLVVAERMGQVDSFGADDLRALQTLAHQAGVALDNGRLVDRLRREAAERAHEALHDALTGLPNRRRFLRDVDEEVASGRPAGVLLLDIDRFKDVNDALGHGVGDELLQVVAGRLRRQLDDDCLLARLGGDEFAVLVPHAAGKDRVGRGVAQIRQAVSGVVAVRDVELHVEVSIGSAMAPYDGHAAEELLQRADVAMYRAKEQRTGYEAYAAARDGSSTERLALYADLRRAIEDRQLDVHFQPVIDPATSEVLFAEALARWHHPVRGVVPPDEFVPLAERTGLIHGLTMVVLESSLQRLACLRAAGLLPRVAVNLSARMLLDPSLPGTVRDLLRASDVPAAALTLEVTETAVMADPEAAMSVLRRLDAIGVGLSIDDFGTGYSSLAYLRNLPVDELKIDRSFVQGLSDDPANEAIVRSTIDLAHQLGLSVVAEGVENEATLRMLGRWGCEAAQGYFVSRPLPPAALATWLDTTGRDGVRPPGRVGAARR